MNIDKFCKVINETLHFDIPEFLKEFGIEDTEPNRERAAQMLADVAEESGLFPGSVSIVHRHKCPRCRTEFQCKGNRSKCIKPSYSICEACKN